MHLSGLLHTTSVLPCFVSPFSRVQVCGGGQQATIDDDDDGSGGGARASASATPSAAGSSQNVASVSAGKASGGTCWTAVQLSALGCSPCVGRASTAIRGAGGFVSSQVRECEYGVTKEK